MRVDEEHETVEEGTGDFETFFQVEHDRLFGTLCLATADAGEAEDLMQEAFVRVWERWARVSSLADPSGYLYRTAFNAFRSRYRKAKRAAIRVFSVAPAADPFAEVAEREAVISALRRLTPRQRAAVVLTEVQDLTSDEAAEVLGVKPVTVRSLASQARAAMKRSLEQADE